METTYQSVGLQASDIDIAPSAKAFKQMLLSEISLARKRILISALYVQDDDAGREILHAIYQAKIKQPQLDICIFVDFHRAQRGLIGQKESLGNRALYLQLEKQYQVSINIYGVPVKRRELLGVLHLKGMIFDNTLLYSGASINDIYLQQYGKYRLDRYYRIQSKAIADNFCQYFRYCFIGSKLVPRLNGNNLPVKKELNKNITRLIRLLRRTKFSAFEQDLPGEIQASLYVGCGKRGNTLNQKIRDIVKQSQNNLVIFTPYFNFPKPLLKDVDNALKRGVQVDITVGDKTANDFFNPDEKTFTTVEVVPYIYERLLIAFLSRREKFIATGQLTVRLWKHDNNSFHLKGIVADDRYHLLTGSNLNPRAWGLDIENGILLDDSQGKLQDKFAQERKAINQHTSVIKSTNQLDTIKDYPEKPRKLIKRIKITQMDRVFKRLL